MNRSESRYFNTAVRMDEALLEILEKKDYAYITVKEICEKAGVNRSTFYLHYETINDLLMESIEYVHQQFLDYVKLDSVGVVSRIRSCPTEELYLFTPEYLMPYLTYIKEHKRLFRTMVDNPVSLQLDKTYQRMFQHVFNPILERFQVPEKERGYMMAFYIQGLMAIVKSWLKNECEDSIEYIISVMHRCIMHK